MTLARQHPWCQHPLGVSVIESDHAFAESEDLEAAVQLRATIRGNLGACFIQTKDYAKVWPRMTW